MSSRFETAVIGSTLVYPNAVDWSEENLIAVACSTNVIIMNPAKPSRSRGMISIPASEPFSVGQINAKGEELQSGCLLPFQLSRETRPFARSISWSPVGLANNAGCLLAVCSTDGRVKVYRFPICECLTGWIEVMDISEMLYKYLENINFGESKSVTSTNLDMTPGQDNTDHEPANKSSTRKKYKPRRKNMVASEESEILREENMFQVVPASESKKKRPKIVVDNCDLQFITAQQYASRSAMLTSLILAWSPILGTSGNGSFAIPHNSSCCSVLAVGGKCGGISFWRINAPQDYSIVNTKFSGMVSLVGRVKAQHTWITAISWAVYGFDVSAPHFILAAGSFCGRVKVWQVNCEELLKSSEVSHSFTLLEEVTTTDSGAVTVLSLTVPSHSPSKLLMAIGKGSGSFEVCILDIRVGLLVKTGCYNAHNHMLTGLAWAFNGRCLYSCSQDNSMKSWIFVENSLCEVPMPSNAPGVKSSRDFANVSDACYGLAVSPGNLALAVARRFDGYLLDPMYEGRIHKGAVEFLWIGGQQLDISSTIHPDIINESFPNFPANELKCWESNILWSLNQFKSSNKILNVWDIVAALMAFKRYSTNYVHHVILKWLTSYFETDFDISTIFVSEAFKCMAKLSSRQLHLINIIIRNVVLNECTTHNTIEEEDGLVGIEEEHLQLWKELLLSSENEIRERLVGFSFSSSLSLLNSSCLDGLAQMEQWVSFNEKSMKNHLKHLATEIGKVERKLLVDEQCSICSEMVPFESTEEGICSGEKCHKIQRCSVTMRVVPFFNTSWFCNSCKRRATKLTPASLFSLPGYSPDSESSTESSTSDTEYSVPCCPLCGILLGRLQPNGFLFPSPDLTMNHGMILSLVRWKESRSLNMWVPLVRHCHSENSNEERIQVSGAPLLLSESL